MKEALKNKAQADKKRAPHKPFQVGCRVYLSTKYLRLKVPCKKLDPKYLGPFPIIRVINPVTLELKLSWLLGRVHPVFHSSLLKPLEESNIQPLLQPPGSVVGDHYVIDQVLDSQLHRGKLQYLVRWKGYPTTDASWVVDKDMGATRLLRRFHQRYPHKLGGREKLLVVHAMLLCLMPVFIVFQVRPW